jgi:hypothetical protein
VVAEPDVMHWGFLGGSLTGGMGAPEAGLHAPPVRATGQHARTWRAEASTRLRLGFFQASEDQSPIDAGAIRTRELAWPVGSPGRLPGA